MLTYNISERGKLPIYEYLYNCIRSDIRTGRLVAGTKLPSKRALASDNGVALITVENAYEQLLIEGYIESRERVGYYVADIPIENTGVVTTEITKRASEGLNENGSAELTANGDKEAKKNTKKSYDEIFDFTSGRRLSDTFPYSTWSKLMRRVLSDKEKEFEKAPQASGIDELRIAISEYLLGAKNLRVDPDCIIVGPGTEYLHSVILQLIGRSRIVAVEDPGYKKAGLIYENNGMKVMHIPLDEEGIAVDKLYDSNVRLVHVSPAHHFPTGIVMSASRRHHLLKWATSQDAYIIEDDYDSEFRFKGKPLPTLMSLDSEHVIYMNTFTGSLAPSIRIAYMVLPDKLRQIYTKRLSFISGTVSTFEQLTLSAFISEGYYERHIGRMRNRYRKLRILYTDTLKKTDFSAVARIEEDTAGLNMILKIRKKAGEEWDDPEFVKKLADRNIFITPMSNYCYNRREDYIHRFVLNYLDLDENTLKKVFDSMNDILQGMQ